MSLLSYRDAIVADIKATLKPRTCETHRGQFNDAAEVKRYAVAAPAVLVAITAAPAKAIGSGVQLMDASVALFVITKDAPKLPRDTGALALVEALQLELQDNFFADTASAAPRAISSQNLYSPAVDKLGVALWGVKFQQKVEATLPLDAATLAAFELFHQDTDTAEGGAHIEQTTEMPQ